MQAAGLDPGVRSDPRTVGRWLFLAAALLVASVVVTTTWRWLHQDRQLAECCAVAGDGVVGIGETIYFAAGAQPAHGREVTLDVRRVSPEVVENSAGALVRVLVCTGRTATAVGGLTGLLDAAGSCDELRAFRPGSVRLGAGDELLIAVTPRHVGTVRVLGSTVSYHDGLRRGTQHVGIDLWVRVRTATARSALIQ